MFQFNSVILKEKAKQISPVTLAFLGDAVYSLFIREKLVLTADYKASDLQKLSSKSVSAHGQSELLEKIIPLFTEEELDIFKRGRNAKKNAKSKNASVSEYNRSTGFEAVLGYLYLTGNYQRINELLGVQDEN
ncbi:MAG: Mini-ribonuclease 3 [Clostridiales bacterium]|nr:Mini-ribonuclease 3 [Clostridiales bacterium]